MTWIIVEEGCWKEVTSAFRFLVMNSCSTSHHLIHINLGLKTPQFERGYSKMSPLMRDRSKNRKPLQRGRISTEAIQAVQALKRSKGDEVSLQRVLNSKVGRLVKTDLLAVLKELHRQDESLLALQVFKVVLCEYWYKPKVSLYAEMVRALAMNEQSEEVPLVISWLKKEMHLEAGDVEGFNSLLAVLVEFDYVQSAMECFHLMKVVGCELQETTVRILVNGFDAKNLRELSDMIQYLGEHINYYSDEEVSSLDCYCS